MPNAEAPTRIKLSEVLAALSAALDLTEGQPIGHCARTCMIGMRLAEELRLSLDERSALFYALLLKDAGCSSNASRISALFAADDHLVKRDRKTTHWPSSRESLGHVLRTAGTTGTLRDRARQVIAVCRSGAAGARSLTEERCERGAGIARSLGLPEATSEAIHGLDEHWDGGGYPGNLRGEEIPLLARIVGLAQTVEVFWAVDGRAAACEMARERSGGWFDPELVAALECVAHDEIFWMGLDLEQEGLRLRVGAMEPVERVLTADEEAFDRISEAFAQVVDAKSPWTFRHSVEVAEIASGIGEQLGLAPAAARDLRRAALLHDIGKLGVSSLILDKPGRLTEREMMAVRRHPAYTASILRQVPGLAELTEIAASHHERLDGSGYHRGLTGADLSLPARALAVADVFEAIGAERPYRPALPTDQVLEIMRLEVGTALCERSFAALERWVEAGQAAIDRGGSPSPRLPV